MAAMRDTIAISLSPNTTRRDLIAAAWSLVTPTRWSDTTRVSQIEKVLMQRFNRPVQLTSSGRSALYYLLQAYGISQGDEVIVQAFTCLAVTAPVTWAQATPVYADIDPQTYNIDPISVAQAITTKTKAIIVQHTFGIPANLTALIAIAKKHNLILIEDLAHAFGGTYEGRPLGTYGDAAILSFGRDKIISSVFGGAIVTNNKAIMQHVHQQQKTLSLPPAWWNIQQLLHPLIMSVIIPTYFFLSFGKILLVLAQKTKLLSLAVSPEEKRGEMPPFIKWQFSPALALLLQSQLDRFDEMATHRHRLIQKYQSQLPSPAATESLTPWLRFPYRITHKHDVLRQARRLNMLLGDWYTTPITPLPTNTTDITHYQPGSCPQAEQAGRETINLPTHSKITTADVDRVITFIKSVTPKTADHD